MTSWEQHGWDWKPREGAAKQAAGQRQPSGESAWCGDRPGGRLRPEERALHSPEANLIPPLTMRPQATKPLCISMCSASKKEYFPTRLSYARSSGTNTSHVTESQKCQFPAFVCSLLRQEQKGTKKRRRWTEYPKGAREKLLKIPPPKLDQSKER